MKRFLTEGMMTTADWAWAIAFAAVVLYAGWMGLKRACRWLLDVPEAPLTSAAPAGDDGIFVPSTFDEIRAEIRRRHEDGLAGKQ